MRWSYLIPRLIILGLIWAFFAFAFDPLIRYSAVQSLQAVTGARADVPVLQTGFFPPRVVIEDVALASHRKPGTNLLQFDTMTFHMAGDPLLRKCFVVDEARVSGVRFGTARNDNGQLEIEPEPDEPETPSWLAEKMKDLGDEWLENFTAQAKEQLNPERLETYRVGSDLYVKWDHRFDTMNAQVAQKKEQIRIVREQLELAKKAEKIQQIEMYLQLAQQADLLLRELRQMKVDYQNVVPEVQQDFQRLDQARQNDQQQVVESIRLLKPDARRITESLLGEQLYSQVQQLISWLELVRSYQEDFSQPPPPARQRGTDFEFPILHPTPKVLCRKMLIDGELMLSQVPTPFEAVLTDVTSDPVMHGRPALLRMSTGGEMPVEIVLRHDATSEIAVTDFAAEFSDPKGQKLSAGKEGRDHLTASLDNIHWVARMTIQEGRMQGQINLTSRFGNPQFATTSKTATLLAGFTEQTLSGIGEVNAKVTLNGTLRHPQISISSDLGDQISGSFQTAFTSFAPQLRAMLSTQVQQLVDDQRQKLVGNFGGRYDKLLSDHTQMMDTLNEVQQIAVAFRNGQVDPNQVIRTVSNAGVLSDKDQQKVNKVQQEANKVMEGLNDPNKAFQDALPSIRKKLFR